MTGPCFHLPTHHALNRYFREQDANMASIFEHTSEEKLRQWGARYRLGKLRPPDLAELANDHEKVLVEANAFGIKRSHRRGSKTLPQRECQNVSAFFMEPISLGQGWLEVEKDAYIEQALFLRVIRTDFRPKKAFIGVGASGVLLTKHLLSRIYERTEVEHSQFADLLHSHIGELLTGLALAEAGDLWVEGERARVTAVPFADGLLLINTRPLFGNEGEGDFGFHMEIPKFKLQNPYINDRFVIDRAVFNATADFSPTVSLCGLTYLNLTTLSGAQSDYFYAFQALRNDVGEDTLNALTFLTFGPNLAHEKWGLFQIKPHLHKLRDRARNLLHENWLRAEETSVACILPFDAKLP